MFLMTLYIHIPFCYKKCRYCSFAVFVAHQDYIEGYLECLSKESARYRGQKVKTIYIGGGTPSYLSIKQLEKLFSIIRDNFKFDKSIEWTFEANPESLDERKAIFLKNVGVNRLSLGVQTFQDKYLRYLGRNHSAGQSYQVYEILREAGFKNINLDFMYLFPGQTFDELKKDLKEIINLQSDHLSLYTLTIEKNSRFFVDKEKLPNEDVQARYYLDVKKELEKKAFKQYEISNFAKRGKQSAHNLNYWQGGNYIGLGVAAHSHISGKRFWNHAHLATYINMIKEKGNAQEGFEELSDYNRLKESLLFGLRMNKGIKIIFLEKYYKARLTNEDWAMIQRLQKEKFLICHRGFLKITQKGQLVLDELCGYLA
ncbi:MAG TPA: radical SAM family heme chaperone HemW [Candidatus Omnitrophota bacterium]|mgnify:FL=1|nr:radical SAM family heme chaperone HemW [Candidatus Omnitrophota bacterium]